MVCGRRARPFCHLQLVVHYPGDETSNGSGLCAAPYRGHDRATNLNRVFHGVLTFFSKEKDSLAVHYGQRGALQADYILYDRKKPFIRQKHL